MSIKEHSLARFFSSRPFLIGAVLTALVYAYFISNVSTNPPGFYVDESCLAYNGYLIATTGAAENGVSFPLYFQCYKQGYTQWANPTHVYLLGLLYLFVPPSTLTARVFAATMVFLAALLLGYLSTHISGRRTVGVTVALTAMFTPWLFEISRLVLETFFYPLAIVLFLFCLYRAHERERWTIPDCFLIAISLSLITYSYTIGRLLGPLLGLGLVLFAVNWKMLSRVFVTWVIYGLTLIPFLVVYLSNNAAITGRFGAATYLDRSKGLWENVSTFLVAYFSDIGPKFLLFTGDIHPRHHVGGMGGILVATFALAVMGLILVLLRHRGSSWWRFIVFGLFASAVPAALTYERSHFLRMVAFPVFLLVLTVPALSWLLDKNPGSKSLEGSHPAAGESRGGVPRVLSRFRFSRRALLAGLLILTALQAVLFQMHFRAVGENRGIYFNDAYPRILNRALEQESRPIYLDDGSEPTYVHAYFYGASLGIDQTTFVHLMDNQTVPPGAVVLSSDAPCSGCEVLHRDGSFALYRNSDGNTNTPSQSNPAALTANENKSAQYSSPRGLAADQKGNLYIADAGNSRIVKLGPDGGMLASFGTAGPGVGEIKEPNGVAIDAGGSIYVTDATNGKLLKYRSDGTFEKEWRGPDPGLYGPRDITFGPDQTLYIIDQGNGRIVKFTPASEIFTSWGTIGSSEGQFAESTGIAVGGGFIFVADNGNNRIQVFRPDGNFVRQWEMPMFLKYAWHYPDVAYDEAAQWLYVTNGIRDEILIYDIDGNQIGDGPKSTEEKKLANPSAMLLTGAGKNRRLYVLNSGHLNAGNSSITYFDIGR